MVSRDWTYNIWAYGFLRYSVPSLFSQVQYTSPLALSMGHAFETHKSYIISVLLKSQSISFKTLKKANSAIPCSLLVSFYITLPPIFRHIIRGRGKLPVSSQVSYSSVSESIQISAYTLVTILTLLNPLQKTSHSKVEQSQDLGKVKNLIYLL